MFFENLDYANVSIITGLIILSVTWVITLKDPKKKEYSINIILLIIFLLLRLAINLTHTSEIFVDKHLHVISLIILALVAIRGTTKLIIGQFLRKKHNLNIPKIFQDFLQLSIFILITLIILKENFKLDTSILITSSALSIVIGLALQDTLGNFFSGLAIQMQRPFEEGDWISFNEHTGIVREIDWRAVKICTLDQDIIVIPNSEIAKASFKNYSKPSRLHRIVIPIGVHYRTPPNLVKEIILNLLTEETEILTDPKPSIVTTKYNDFSIDYEIRVFTNNFNRYKEIIDSIYTKIWYHFKRNDITIPFPIRDVYLHEVKTKNEDQLIKSTIKLLKSVDFLGHLTEEEFFLLASNIGIHKYAKDEIIIKQGEAGSLFYLINDGRLNIILTDEEGNKKCINTLTNPSFFGELSLLTGSPTTATVIAETDCELLTLNQETFKSFLMSNPHIAEEISEIISHRQSELELSNQVKSAEEREKELKEKSTTLLAKITRIFGL